MSPLRRSRAKEADIVRGTWVAPPTGKVTFGDYSLTWLQRQGHLRPRTRELYEVLLRKHIDPTFGPRSLTAIANSEVVAWNRALSAKVTGTAPKCFRLLRQIMAAAVADGYLVKSPVVIKGASREHVDEQAIPTPAEVDALAETVDPRYRAMIWLAGACGLRFGELAALRRDRVDLLHKEVRVGGDDHRAGRRRALRPRTTQDRIRPSNCGHPLEYRPNRL